MVNLFLNLLIISAAVFSFLLICIILKRYGQEIDAKQKRMDYVAQKSHENQVFDELNLSFYNRIILPKISKVLLFISSTFPSLLGNDKSNAELERQIKLAGMNTTVGEYSAGKTIFMLVDVFITFILAIILSGKGFMIALLVCVMGFLLAILIPRLHLQSKIRNRKKTIQNSLADVIDLLSVSMTAGLSFDASVQRITEKMSGPFIDELKNMHRDLQMGRPRREALKNLGEACDIEELRTFTSAVIQADQMGIPIKNILGVQSRQLRLTRKQRAQEQGAKAPVKMLIPMVIFIFPIIFIVLLGPAAMNIMENLL